MTIKAVLDAVGSERAALFGVSEGGNMSCMFAALHPERVSALALFGSFARGSWAPDYPWRDTGEGVEALIKSMREGWGTAYEDLTSGAPSAANDLALMRLPPDAELSREHVWRIQREVASGPCL